MAKIKFTGGYDIVGTPTYQNEGVEEDKPVKAAEPEKPKSFDIIDTAKRGINWINEKDREYEALQAQGMADIERKRSVVYQHPEAQGQSNPALQGLTVDAGALLPTIQNQRNAEAAANKAGSIQGLPVRADYQRNQAENLAVLPQDLQARAINQDNLAGRVNKEVQGTVADPLAPYLRQSMEANDKKIKGDDNYNSNDWDAVRGKVYANEAENAKNADEFNKQQIANTQDNKKLRDRTKGLEEYTTASNAIQTSLDTMSGGAASAIRAQMDIFQSLSGGDLNDDRPIANWLKNFSKDQDIWVKAASNATPISKVGGTDVTKDNALDYAVWNIGSNIGNLAGYISKPVQSVYLATVGIQTFGNEYDTGMEMGLPQELALARATGKTVGEVGSEFIPFGVFEKLMGVGAKIPAGAKHEIMKRILTSSGAAAAVPILEGSEEVINSMWGAMVDNVIAKHSSITPEQRKQLESPAFDWKREADAFIAGSVGAGIGGVIGIASGGYRNVQVSKMQQAVNYTINTGNITNLTNENLANLKSVAEAVNAERPNANDVVAIEKEIARRANTPTLQRAAEVAQNEQAADEAEMFDGIEASNLLEDDTNDANTTSGMDSNPVGLEPDNLNGGAPTGILGRSADTVDAEQPIASLQQDIATGTSDTTDSTLGEIIETGGIKYRKIANGFERVHDDVSANISINNDNDIAAHDAATSKLNEIAQPTDRQKEAGNYKKGSVNVSGLNISVENPQGSTRTGTDKSGNAWETTMQDHYGYVKGVTARSPDKEHVDTYVKAGTDESFNGDVFVVDQKHPDGKFDESKVMIGYANQAEAEAAYDAHYAADWTGKTGVTALPMDTFKAKLNEPNAFMQPHAPITPEKGNEPAPAQEPISTSDNSIRPYVTELVKLRAAASQMNKSKSFDAALIAAKDLMDGKPVNAKKFKNLADIFKNDEKLKAVLMQLHQEALNTPEALAAKEAKSATARAAMLERNKIDATKDGLMQAMAKLGGLKHSVGKSEFGIDPADMRSHGAGIKKSFTVFGKDADEMRELLLEQGYPVGETVAEFGDAIADAMSGHDIMTPEGQEELARKKYEEYSAIAEELSDNEQATLDANFIEAEKLLGADIVTLIDVDNADEMAGSNQAEIERGLIKALEAAIHLEKGNRLANEETYNEREDRNASQDGSGSSTSQTTEGQAGVDNKSDSGKTNGERAQQGSGENASQVKTASWVIKEKSTGAIQFETFDKAKVDALNTDKYEAVPIMQHLQELNKSIKDGNAIELTGQTSQEIAAAEAAKEAATKAKLADDAKLRAEQAAKDKTDLQARNASQAGNTDNFVFGESAKDAKVAQNDMFGGTTKSLTLPKDEVTKATKALTDAGITGTEKLNTIKDVRDGKITADEVADAHPPKAPTDTAKEKTIDELQADFKAAQAGIDNYSGAERADKRNILDVMHEAAAALTKANTKLIKVSLEDGKMPVLSMGNLTFALHPATDGKNKYQVTRYNEFGAFGDTRYETVEQAINDNDLGTKELLSNADAKVKMAALAKAEMDYQEAKAAAPFTHAGFNIYRDAKSRWLVQSVDNFKAGKLSGFGDGIYQTKQEAMDDADLQYRHMIEHDERVVRIDAENALIKAEEEARIAKNRGLTITERKANHSLEKQISIDGKVSTLREAVEKLVADGAKLETYETNKIKPMSRMAYFRASQKEQDAHEKRIKDEGKKTVYSIGNYELGKAAYDYALTLNAKLEPIRKPLSEQQTTKPKNLGAKVTPQVMSNAQAKSFVNVAADSIEQLRKQDVERVLNETPEHFKGAMANYIKENRSDLADEVDAINGEVKEMAVGELRKTVRQMISDGLIPRNSITNWLDGDLLLDAIAAAKQSAPVTAPANEPSPDDAGIKKADDDLDDALSEFGDIFGQDFRATITPEQEGKLLPVLTKLIDAAFRKGYYEFKKAARFVLKTIREKFGNAIADFITIDHLQAAYINMAGRYGDKATSKKEVINVETLQDLGEDENVIDERSSTDLERDSQDANTQDGVGETSLQAERTGNSGTRGQRVQRTQSQSGAGSSGSLFGYETAIVGERGDSEIYTGETAVEGRATGSSDDSGSGDSGFTGTPIEPDATSIIGELAESGFKLETAKIAQKRADKLPHNSSLANIRETLPILTEGQQEDVFIAETRFAIPDGYGMLFTNGTGTGKTFTGLGVIKRFDSAGKKNILVVAPNDKIIEDWQNSGKLLGLNLNRLNNTNDAGKDIVITTYANVGQNDDLAKRDWDLVVHDEAHYLAMDSNGTNTNALKSLRAITNHPRGASERANMLHRDLLNEMDSLNASAKSLRLSDDERHWAQAEIVQAKADSLHAEWREKSDAVKAQVKASQGAERTRVIFLSATPFAYEKTVDLASGYLFDYSEGKQEESQAYNAGSHSDQFMMQHFGYRMRFNKLTQPDAKVNRGLMQRQFNTWMKKRGVLAGRMLDVKADYDRKFVLIDSAIGERIDEALQWFEVERVKLADTNKPRRQALSDMQAIIAKKFDYLSRRYLLEAIKAKAAVPHIKEHLALGRKVVVFHDYKKGGGFNPFDIQEAITSEALEGSGSIEELNKVINEFRVEFKDLINSNEWAASSPIEEFKKNFPNVMLFNGDVHVKTKRENVAKFQDDDSGANLILVQTTAGREGISLHDTTGKHQRVLFNLGQPTAPTTSIQQEGRIYRTGQVTDAIFRYFNTGTNWERWAFATTIAQRASAAENLAMGEQARALQDAFITGFEESDDYRAGMEGEGKGGKERDRAANEALTEYDRAKAFYYGTGKKTSKNKAQEGADYYATPEPIGLKMVEFADIRGGEKALEPSAGHGAIARWMPENADNTAIEPSLALRPRLAMSFGGNIIGQNFEDLHVVNKFDAIVMNPPFGSAGTTAVAHIAKAATHLNDGGRIVALIPLGAADTKFDKWLYGEAERDIKPIKVIAKQEPLAGIEYWAGSLYKGDAIETRTSFAPKATVVRIDAAGMLWVVPEGEKQQMIISTQAITKVKPTGKRKETYRPADGLHLVANIMLPAVTFERAGTKVMTRIVVIEKTSVEGGVRQINRDYSEETDINALFDRMEDLTVQPRAKAVEAVPEDAPAETSFKSKTKESDLAAKVRDASNPDAIAKEGDAVTFEIKDGKLITNAPAEKVTTNSGKELEGVFVTDTNISASDIKGVDRFAYSPRGRAAGMFVRLRHVERPSADDAPMFIRSNTSSLDTAKRRMGKFVTEFERGRLKDSDTQVLGDTPTVLRALGAKNLPLQIDGATVSKVLAGKHKNDISADNLRQITDGIYDPLAVFKSEEGGFIFLTEIKSLNGNPVIAAIHVNKQHGGITVNDIASVYEKSRAEKSLESWVNKGLLAYVRNENGLSQLATRHPELASIANKMKDRISNVLSENEVVKQYGDRFLQESQSNPTGLSISEVKEIASVVAEGWKKVPEIIVIESLDDPRVAESVRNKDAEMKAKGSTGDPIGFISRGKVYVLAPRVSTPSDVATVLLHEIFGHYGLRGNFGSGLNNILDQITIARGVEVRAKATQYGLDFNTREGKRHAAEEVLAEWAQTNPKLGFVKQAIAAIRTWLRTNITYFKNIEITDDEIINNILIPARNFVESGKRTNAINSMGLSTLKPVYRTDSGVRFARQKPLPMIAPKVVPPTAANNNTLGLAGGNVGNMASFGMPVSDKLDTLVYKYQDKHIDLKRATQQIAKNVAAIHDSYNPYMQETLYHKRTAKRTEDFALRELNPLLELAASHKLSLDEIDSYLHARHAKEANDYIATIEPSMQDGGSGMSNQDAADYMANLDPAKQAALALVAAKVDDIIEGTKQIYVSYGLISQDQIDDWSAMFKSYVPLMRDVDNLHTGTGVGQGFSIKGKEVKHRTGSTADNVVDILANIAMQREKAIVRGEKNRVSVALAGMVKINHNPDFWQLDKIPTERVLNEKTGLVEVREIPNYRTRENVIIAKIKNRKGQIEERVIVMNEKDERAVRLADAFKNLDAEQFTGAMSVAKTYSRWFASVNTQYNPVFGAVNLTRDVGESMLNLSSTELKGHKLEVLANVLPALAGVYTDARKSRKGHTATSNWAHLWEEFNLEGGATGFRDNFANSEDRANQIKDVLNPDRWQESKLGKIFTVNGTLKVPMSVARKGAAWVFNLLDDYNLAMENAVRLSAYKAAIDKGMSRSQAANLAKNLTVNFNRKGSKQGQQAGALFAFFNASMQGTARIAETVFEKDGFKLSSAGKVIITGGILLGMVQQVLLLAAGFGDDDDPPKFVRERSFIIPIGGKRYLTIPYPLGYSMLPNIGRITTEWAMSGGKNTGAHLSDLFASTIGSLSPIGNSGFSWQTFAPTIFDPFIALLENKDGLGRNIAIEDRGGDRTAGHTRTRDTATSTSRFISEAINYITGGTKYTAGLASPTPDQVDFLGAQLGGGVYRELSKTEQLVASTFTGEALPAHKIPLIGRFYGNADSVEGQGKKFYANLDKFNDIKLTIDGMRDDKIDTTSFKESEPLTKLIGNYKLAKRQVSKLRQKKRALVEAGRDKQDVIEIEGKIKNIMTKFNDKVERVEAIEN